MRNFSFSFSPLSFHLLHDPLHGFPFLFILPSFYLSQPHVKVAIKSISPLVHNRLSACNSTSTSALARSSLQARAGWIPQALWPEKLTGAIGKEGFPLTLLCNTIVKEKENSVKSDNETLLQWSATAVIITARVKLSWQTQSRYWFL